MLISAQVYRYYCQVSIRICHHRPVQYPRIMLHLTVANKRWTCYLLSNQCSIVHGTQQIQHPHEYRSHNALRSAANCHLLACCTLFLAGQTPHGRFPSDRLTGMVSQHTRSRHNSGQAVQAATCKLSALGLAANTTRSFRIARMFTLQWNFFFWLPCSNSSCDSALARISHQHLLSVRVFDASTLISCSPEWKKEICNVFERAWNLTGHS
jgi:hypothetical protein